MIEEKIQLSDKIIVCTRADGSVSITQLVHDDIDIDAEVLKITAADPDLTFRFNTTLSDTGVAINFFYGALALDEDDNIAYDMSKARNIWKDIMRNARSPKLADLDIQYQIADEAGNTSLKETIVANKNILRDCTSNPDIESAQSLNDLRRTLPDLLED
tara:strand:+ start:823 stop:1299 length:477 start_codon:yes stop_codon:yes gene_type:complete